MRILSGVQTSGQLHIGNYFGAIRQFVALQEEPGNECFYFLADLHAMTTIHDPDELRRNSRHVAAAFVALGLDPDRSVLYRQSDVPEVAELAWMLSTVTPMGLLQRCHSYKDKTARGIAPSHGLFAYPVLMAADILIVRADRVPVGRDQKQHLEVTRDIAQAFNQTYGDVLVLPEEMIQPDVAVVPGVDGRKMSKSYGNTLEIFQPEKQLRKRVMSIVTDSTPVEEPKPTEGNALHALLKVFTPTADWPETERMFTEGGTGYGDIKKRLFGLIMETFGTARTRYEELMADPGSIEAVLERGRERAGVVIGDVMAECRRVTGAGPA